MTFSLDFLEVDSEVLGLSAWNLTGVKSPQDFYTAIESRQKKETRNYITCKLAIDDIVLIHAAEAAGFNYVETQFQTTLRLTKTFETAKYPYDYVRVDSQEQLLAVQNIAEETILHDRFTRDPRVGKISSGMRYRRYLEDSYHRDDDEIWAVKSRSTGQLLTFRSHRILSKNEVSLLIGGVHPSFKDIGLGVISSHFCFNQLRSAGFRRALTYISAANTPIMNLEVGHFDFRIGHTFVVMRAVLD